MHMFAAASKAGVCDTLGRPRGGLRYLTFRRVEHLSVASLWPPTLEMDVRWWDRLLNVLLWSWVECQDIK